MNTTTTNTTAAAHPAMRRSHPHKATHSQMQFSLFYFYSDNGEGTDDKYRMLIEGAKFADRNGFAAIWTPERHFHEFGGIYPNPALTGAALAAITENVQIRAGSVVLPLHHPIRVAEEWSVVDNLSHGRAAISVASGWHADDFVLGADNYEDRKQVMIDSMQSIQRLWRGDSLAARNGTGKEIEVRIYPRPVQDELPVWTTCSGSPDTFALAGELGTHLLTHLLGQDIEELADKIQLYRQTLAHHGYDPQSRTVTLMLHTYLDEDVERVREKVRAPFSKYLASSIGLIQRQLGNVTATASATPWRGRTGAPAVNSAPTTVVALSEREQNELVKYAFDRYFGTSALFGSPQSCLGIVNQLKQIGVDEVACLVDFGVDTDAALAGLNHLKRLKDLVNAPAAGEAIVDLVSVFNESLELYF